MSRPADPSGDNSYGGVYYAIVTQNDDDEGSGARVKVRYPWLPEGDRDQSYWAPICVPMIGSEFGTYTLPEVEDEVMVVFLSGDLQYPVIIGGGWSQTDPPPETNEDGKNDFRLIKTRAGHRLILDDSSNTKVVLTDVENKHMLDVGKHAGAGSSPNAVTVPAMGGQKGVSAAASSGALNLWCPSGKLKIQAKDVEITASMSADIKGGSEASFTGATEASVSGSTAAKIQGMPLKIGAG